jgi:hypothetical protein
MARTTPSTAAPMSSIAAVPMFDFSAAAEAGGALMRMQRLQWDLMLTWQKSLAASQQELWDQWTSHWAGGVPLDG